PQPPLTPTVRTENVLAHGPQKRLNCKGHATGNQVECRRRTTGACADSGRCREPSGTVGPVPLGSRHLPETIRASRTTAPRDREETIMSHRVRPAAAPP